MPSDDFTSADFHNAVQKQVLNAAYETLATAKLDWALVVPFLEAARDVCRADFRQSASLRIHTVRADGDKWVDAEEAYLGIAVADRDDGREWLSETWWLSDIAISEKDPQQVRRIIAALQRTIGKLEAWIGDQEREGPAEPL